ncbi:MAG: hypothetical protein ACAI43_14010 [Phycisphaerae bacterium]|nr:hypothetical protein [Tepidisphaeraceae bacterium]
MSNWMRDLSSKVVRRLRQIVRRPDPRPWVLRPSSASGPAYVDFVIGIDFLHNHSKLVQMFYKACSAYGVSMLLANKHNVRELAAQAKAGKIRPHVYLDLCSATNKEFGELLKAFAGAGVYTIGSPEKLDLWTWKARAQKPLEQAGMPVPPTVLVKAGEPSRDLTAEERAAVGEKVVIKPSWGVAQLGVVVGARPTAEAIEKARQFAPDDDYLVQRLIKWERCGERSAYVRGYNVCGTRTLLWWSPETRMYDMVTWDDVRRYDLMGALDLVDRMSRLTGMEFFSSEIAITNGVNQPRFVLIDYCNDQCDLNPVSVQADGPPDEWSAWAVERLAEFVWRKRSGLPEADGYPVWLAGASNATAGAVTPASDKGAVVSAA